MKPSQKPIERRGEEKMLKKSTLDLYHYKITKNTGTDLILYNQTKYTDCVPIVNFS
jgi:hypothetical protein